MEHFMRFSTPIDASICFVGVLVLFVVFVCRCGCSFFLGIMTFLAIDFSEPPKKEAAHIFFNLQIFWPQISSESPKDLKNLGFREIFCRISCGRKRSLVANSWPLVWRREETHYEFIFQVCGADTDTAGVFWKVPPCRRNIAHTIRYLHILVCMYNIPGTPNNHL